MTIHRLHLPTRKTGRDNRSMLEHLLLLGEEIVEKQLSITDKGILDIKIIDDIIKGYFEKNDLDLVLSHEHLASYLLAAADINYGTHDLWKKISTDTALGLYSSQLLNLLDGSEPFEIDFGGKKSDRIFYKINSKRQVVIMNAQGSSICQFAGDEGFANIKLKNIKGNGTAYGMGIRQGQVEAILENVEGEEIARSAAADGGRAKIFMKNVKGNYVLRDGGNGANNYNKGDLFVVGYNVQDTDLINSVVYRMDYERNCLTKQLPIQCNGVIVIKNAGEELYMQNVTGADDPVLLEMIDSGASLSAVAERIQEIFWWKQTSKTVEQKPLPRVKGGFWN